MPFTPPTLPPAISCRVCMGDPRASVSCKECRGAGIAVPGTDAWLTWRAAVNEQTAKTRVLRQQGNNLLHGLLALLILICLGAFAGMSLMNHSVVDLLTWSFWTTGFWYVSLLWLGLFLGCFLIFHASAYNNQTKILPNWGKPKQLQEPKQIGDLDFKNTVDVSVYFLPSSLSVIEQAYVLATRVQRTEIQPVHLFAAVLASSAGGIFTTRLGLEFDKIKDSISTLIRRGETGSPTSLSKATKEVLIAAYQDARDHNRKHVSPIEVFIQAFYADAELQQALDMAGYPPEHVTAVAEWIRIQELMHEEHDRFVQLARLKPSTGMNRTMTARQTTLLDRFSEDLTLAARNGYIAPVSGRQREIEEILRAIESGRRSVVLVGDAGVGKTSLVEALARRMVEEDVPKELFDKRLVAIQLPQVIAAGDPAMAVDRLLRLLYEVGGSGNIILVLHGIEALAGGGTGPMDLAEAFAAELKKGYFIAIGTTTPSAWNNYLERRSLGSQLIRVNVTEMEAEDALKVLMTKAGLIEYQNQVFFTFAALDKSVKFAKRYVQDQRLPSSALAIAREAATLAKRERGEHTFVTGDDVAKIVHEKTNIPVEAVSRDESKKLLELETHLHDRIIGQEDAVSAVSQAMRRARADVREGKRPIANFLFMGPTGVGKTELAKALAAEYFGNEQAMVRLDMSEYQDRSSIARVIGAPGDEHGGLLTEAVRKNPFTIVLLDELEKANPDILTLFLQVMDDGRLTDGVGRTIDFTNIVLIATSNAGTGFIQEQVSAGTPMEQIKTALLERELKGIFRPEFLNRFDAVIVFKPLSQTDVTQIARLMLQSITKRLEDKGITFRAEDAAVEELAVLGFDPLFGARPLRRVIQERVENALADMMLRNEVSRRDTLTLEPGGKLRVEKATLA